MRSGDAAGAIRLCVDALRRYPGDANLLCLAGKALIVLRRFVEAEEKIAEAIRLFPEYAAAHEAFGDLLLVQGQATAAIRAYEQAVRLDPTRGDAHLKIARARQMLSEARDTPAQRSEPEARSPTGTMAFADDMARAEACLQTNEPEKAEDIYRRVLTRDPDHVEAARQLATIAANHQKFREAEVFLSRAVENAPDYARAWVDLSNVQRELERFDDAEASARQVIRLAPDMAESHMLLAGVLGMAGRIDDAMASYRRALELEPGKPGALSGLAHHLKTIGQQDEAIACYRRAIAAKPDHAEAYWSLANLKTFRFEPHEIDAMHALLDRDDLADDARAQINNALGLEYEAQKKYDAAFQYFDACNKLRRQKERYDPVKNETGCDNFIELFDESFLASNAGQGFPDDAAIFIVGLPRSGSTLIEQILASHSQVEGTHELSDFSRSMQETRKNTGTVTRIPEAAREFDADQWRGLGERYIERTLRYRSGVARFIDKNPNNFSFIGAIKLALPNAKIINARRHPLDSCLGSFKQLFAQGQPFSYDLTELGEYYLQYQRLMDHWHRLLPGFVLDVHYEDVVANLDSEVRRILAFCALDFEDQCLRFHETERAIKTASSEQVRQPLYSSSVNLWRNYEQDLDELVHIMTPVLERLPLADQPQVLATRRRGSR